MDHPSRPRIRLWMGSALSLFLLASILGLVMRLKVLSGIPILPFRNLLHAHSHTALLGFGFLFILGAYIFLILPPTPHRRIYHRLWIIYLIAAIGMVISFLYQSYGPISISFSTVIMLTAYTFVYYFLKDYRKSLPERKNPLIAWSTFWFLISTLGIWVLGPVSVILGKAHDLYFLSIQFFLHFQFNGWFMYAVLGLLVYLARTRGQKNPASRLGLWFLNISLILTYFLSVTYVDGRPIFFLLTSVGVILQIVAYYLILKPVILFLIKNSDFNQWTTWILMTGIACVILKVLLQGLVVFPSLAVVSYAVREFIVGYIHLILLGGMTLTVAGILLKQYILVSNRWSKMGWIGLTLTFILMEIILFVHAILMWQGMGNASIFIQAIFYVTIPFPVFAGCIVLGAWNVTKAALN